MMLFEGVGTVEYCIMCLVYGYLIVQYIIVREADYDDYDDDENNLNSEKICKT